MKNKKGVVGEMLFVGYRILIITLAAFVVLVANAVYYNNDLNVKQAESYIMLKNTYNCLVEDSVLKNIPEESEAKILESCGYSSDSLNRFYIKVEIVSDENTKLLSEGDSGKIWIYDLIKSEKITYSKLNSIPGFSTEYFIIKDIEGNEVNIKIEVLVTDEK